MRSLIGRIVPAREAGDYAPSRAAYRLHRLWLTPLFHRILRRWLPAGILIAAAALWLSEDENAQALADAAHDLRRAYEEMPVFAVSLLEIDGADPDLSAEMRQILPVRLPVSSYDLDLEAIREALLALPPVAEADLAISGGTLRVTVRQRVPVALWRDREGMHLVDGAGVVAETLEPGAPWPDLPLIAGEEADAAVAEALAVRTAAGPLGPKLRGLVRIGGRRWDAELKGGGTILLPADGAVRAMERAVALDAATDMLSRDVSRIDLRLPGEPVVRLRPRAVESFEEMRVAAREARAAAREAAED